MENLVVYKEVSDIVVGLIEGRQIVEERQWWNGGIDSCINAVLKDVEVIHIYNKENSDLSKRYIQLDKEDENGIIGYVELNNDLYNRIILDKNITNSKIEIV